MTSDPPKLDLLDCGLYISYMNYFATGEGATSCVAVGSSRRHAEVVLKKRIDEYFHRGVETAPIDREMDEDARRMLARVPDDVKDSLRLMPRGAGHYFSEFYYNLS
ncbi:hypothetical protein [Rhodanobacter sp. MP7CTX1]|uniref:hypothetical protein n=1 Tax=Rhodanobacter sp. MP7CTX1 TaxID=2723084 RepID=UPI00161D907E|nr:hypothetical protein [Rhodanobacter sp. MP7CTX1]MBB6187559.1 hypothetical protein [Rhodanobacter sp. MP7CTX1]